jgi:hypothetical protein
MAYKFRFKMREGSMLSLISYHLTKVKPICNKFLTSLLFT